MLDGFTGTADLFFAGAVKSGAVNRMFSSLYKVLRETGTSTSYQREGASDFWIHEYKFILMSNM